MIRQSSSKPVLLREHLGQALRAERIDQGLTLREVSAAAQVSLGYLSEIERGQKEASSELLLAICQALNIGLADLLLRITHDLIGAEVITLPMASAHAA